MYKLFVFEYYYPEGGMNDVVGEFDSVGDALIYLVSPDEYGNVKKLDEGNRRNCGEFQIVNSVTWGIEREGTWRKEYKKPNSSKVTKKVISFEGERYPLSDLDE